MFVLKADSKNAEATLGWLRAQLPKRLGRYAINGMPEEVLAELFF
jgi:hypothetical protein